MESTHLIETLETRLAQKVERQAVLQSFFVRLCVRSGFERDATRRLKICGDKQRLSDELDVLNGEILGLCRVLNAEAMVAAR